MLAGGASLAVGLTARKSEAAGDLRDFDRALVRQETRDLPALAFTEADGTPRTLADYAGKRLVLNFWATWCSPCVAEMPDLDRLVGLLGPDWAVLPLSSDSKGAPVVQAWFQAHAIAYLPILLDPHSAAVNAIGARGIPTTIVVGADGRERGRLEGAVDWTASSSLTRLRALAG